MERPPPGGLELAAGVDADSAELDKTCGDDADADGKMSLACVLSAAPMDGLLPGYRTCSSA